MKDNKKEKKEKKAETRNFETIITYCTAEDGLPKKVQDKSDWD